MRGCLLLFIIAAAVFIIATHNTPSPKEKAIIEHRVTLAMTPEEVTRSWGKPDAAITTPEGKTIWGYNNGTYATFAGRTLVDSGLLSKNGAPSRPGAGATGMEPQPQRGDWMLKNYRPALDQRPHR